MAQALPFFQIIGTAVSVISALQQGNAAKSAANFNAQTATQNAEIARQQATDQATQSSRENYLRLGAIRAAQGRAGGTGDAGSVLDVLGDTAAQGEIERQDIIYQGELKARGFANTATLERAGGSAAQTGGFLKAGSELLGGTIKTVDAFDRLKSSSGLKRTG